MRPSAKAVRHVLVDTSHGLAEATQAMRACAHVALDVEALQREDGLPGMGRVSLIQMQPTDRNALIMGSSGTVYIVDALALPPAEVGGMLRKTLEATDSVKMLYDFREDYRVLRQQFGITLPYSHTLDLQLMLAASMWKKYGVTMRQPLEQALKHQLDITVSSTVKSRMREGGVDDLWALRPMTPEALAYAAGGVEHTDALWQSMRAHYEHAKGLSRLAYREVERAFDTGEASAVAPSPAAENDGELAEGGVQHVPKEWLYDAVGTPGQCPTCCQPGHFPEACRHTQKIQAKLEGDAIDSDSKPQKDKPVLRCTHCGGVGHTEAHCFKKRKRVFKCEHCGELGHTRAFCRHLGLAKKVPSAGKGRGTGAQKQRQHAQPIPGSAEDLVRTSVAMA